MPHPNRARSAPVPKFPLHDFCDRFTYPNFESWLKTMLHAVPPDISSSKILPRIAMGGQVPSRRRRLTIEKFYRLAVCVYAVSFFPPTYLVSLSTRHNLASHQLRLSAM
ncbi:hypothetical protein NA56DRAFT_712616 [Hyaloscypha hepaticicola]|uniref:Uncharacterized protein n=1 Tax=Hyaloscypha hepaticicola TaxID=2082293 RepID=A0A2J6PG29_9HELO|nr:hypothetical protein NA56DRAFT_712616 [Hyaloscypha hepaticicola]